MNWEDVYDVLCESAIDDTSPLGREVMLLLKSELGDRIIIKKGEKRHPQADILHEIAENPKKGEALAFGDWCPFDGIYRIKPSEPVYEYLWLSLRNSEDFGLPTNKYRTEEEAKIYFGTSFYKSIKVEQTKRERKND